MADDYEERIARLDAMLARAQSLPSLPDMAVWLVQLTQALATLTARVAALEQECEALRQRERLRLWDREASEGT